MLKQSNFVVNYTNNKNCFCSINRNTFSRAPTTGNVCLNVARKDRSVVLWANFSSISEGCIGINAQFAKVLNLEENTDVNVSIVQQLPPVQNKVAIKAVSEEDWLILEANSERFQYSLLDQIRIVVPNQKLLLWVSPSLSICVTTSSYGILEKHSEVEVEPFSDSNTIKKLDGNFQRKGNEIAPIITKNIHNLMRFDESKPCFSLRAIIANIDFEGICHPFTVFINERLLNDLGVKLENPFYSMIIMEKGNEKLIDSDEATIKNDSDFLTLTIEIKRLSENAGKSYGLFQDMSVFIPDVLNKVLQIETGTKLYFENTHVSSHIEVLEIIPIVFKEDVNVLEFADLDEKFKCHVIDCEKTENGFLINSGTIVDIGAVVKHPIQLNLGPKNVTSVLVTSETIRNCKMIINTVDNISDVQRVKNDRAINLEDVSRTIKPFECLVSECVQLIKHNLMVMNTFISRELPNKFHFLLTGPVGSGKSTLCEVIAVESGLWHLKISCRALKGKKDIGDIFSKSFKICEEYSPSIMIWDDVDSILPIEAEGTSHQDIAYYSKLSSSLKHMILNSDSVFVIMTAEDVSAVNINLIQSKGDGIFNKRLTVPELEDGDRCEILQSFIKQRIHGIINIKKLNLNVCISETVGYKIKDLVEYTDKKLFNLVKHLDLNADLDTLASVINNEKPVEKDSNDEGVWDNIGGLKAVKQALVESISWPLMYPALFPPQCGGILLYGPPGTGKSLIGSCVAQLSNMSFISVKGPELLSKYIGQSEMAVRTIFQKARKKSPCILFFDEFDSLAPSRGHDSTGVTDRVVNQLLTQMDGVEGAIRGVIIIAATSRPDLIDAALLRPGRFGKMLLCQMPNEDERLEILETLSKTVDLTEDVNLPDISKKTTGFSGADLKAVLVTAQLMALEAQISEDSKANSVVPLSKRFIDLALLETKPSLSEEKLQYYERIYSRFNGEAKMSVQKVSQMVTSKPRATLA